MPQIAILSPADAWEMTACMELAVAADGPVYLRMGKSDRGAVHSRRPTLEWGRLSPLRDGGSGPAWIATGAMVAGLLGGALPFLACVKVKSWFGYDDALDVLWYGLAVAVVSATLLAVRWLGGSARH